MWKLLGEYLKLFIRDITYDNYQNNTQKVTQNAKICMRNFSGMACTSNPCMNGGTCKEDEASQGKVMCTCATNFGGNICQTDTTGELMGVK